MKRHWIEYHSIWRTSSMTYWVHVEADAPFWNDATKYQPPVPPPVPGKGYALYFVEINSARLWFASLEELQVCIQTLSQKVLPSNLILSRRRGTGYGPSNHWLNRLPLRSMTWTSRQKVVKYLAAALADFAAQQNRRGTF